MDEPPEEVFKYFEPEGFSEKIPDEKDIYKKYTFKDFPELVPYYDKLFNLSLEIQTILNPNLYKRLKEKIQKEELTQDNKILLAKIYGQLIKFQHEIHSLYVNAISVMLTKYSIRLKVINRTLHDVAKIKKILTRYEYKYGDYPSNIGDDEFYKKLESFREAGFPHETIVELFRMREQIAARLLFTIDLENRYKKLTEQIIYNKGKIIQFFDNPNELFNIYRTYVFPFYDLPEKAPKKSYD
jgi:hypothetical protein